MTMPSESPWKRLAYKFGWVTLSNAVMVDPATGLHRSIDREDTQDLLIGRALRVTWDIVRHGEWTDEQCVQFVNLQGNAWQCSRDSRAVAALELLEAVGYQSPSQSPTPDQ